MATACALAAGLAVLAAIVRLVWKRSLGIALGAMWSVAVGALLVVACVPPLGRAFASASSTLFASPPYAVAITAFLAAIALYLSVSVSALQLQVRDLVRHLGLREAAARRPGESGP